MLSGVSGEKVDRLVTDASLHDQFATKGLDEPLHRRELGVVPVLDAGNIHLRHAEGGGEFLLADMLMLAQPCESILAQDFPCPFLGLPPPVRECAAAASESPTMVYDRS